MLSYEIKYLTTDDSIQLKGCDLTTFKYETKKKSEQTLYDTGKRTFCELRGGHWRVARSRQLRQLESKLRDRSVILCRWVNDTVITVVFSSGAIAHIIVNVDTLDVKQILFDKFCVGKLTGQVITDAVLCNSHILFTHADRLASLVTFGKNSFGVVPCLLADRNPHIQSIELTGGSRKAERHMSCCENDSESRLLIWSTFANEPAPWSPIIEDHANLHIYQIQGQQVSLIAYHQLENDTLSAEISQNNYTEVHIVEQNGCPRKGISIEWARYALPMTCNKVYALSSLRESVVRASLPTTIRAVQRSSCESRVLVACIDSSLHIIHRSAGLTHSTSMEFIATSVYWAGELPVAIEDRGRMQCFDRALSSLHHHTKCIDLSSYFRDSENCRIQAISTRGAKAGALLLATFAGGPFGLIRLKHPNLLMGWIRSGRIGNAVALLRTLNWEHEGVECLWATSRIIHEALRRSDISGGETHVEKALGAFLAPQVPHTQTALRYAPHVHDLARKFFHHLLRRGRIEKALSLAVDLCAWDLFADARWAAQRSGLTDLAEEAAGLADYYGNTNQHESECSDCSECSSNSCCTDSEESSNLSSKTKPTPLPRVSLPQAIITVPVTQTEFISTQSIRPNLHQYLDRDNTIWNTDAKQNLYSYKTELKQNNQDTNWNSADNMSANKHGLPKHTSVQSMDDINLIKMGGDVLKLESDRYTQFRHLYSEDLGQESSNLYRYYNSCHMNGTILKSNTDTTNRSNGERSKVKFSDTVKVAVVSEPPLCPEPARELADSLPLCAPHKYLAAFARHPPTPAHPTSAGPALIATTAGTSTQKPPKIKVVHFGMV